MVGVAFTDLSEVLNGRVDFGDYASLDLIQKFAEAPETDRHELLFLAQKSARQDSAAERQASRGFLAARGMPQRYGGSHDG